MALPSNEEDFAKFIRCSACKVDVDRSERNSHYLSDWHRYNVKRKCVSMEPIGRDVFEKKVLSIMQTGQKLMSGESIKKRKQNKNKKRQQNYDTLMKNEQWIYSAAHSAQSTQQIAGGLLNYRCTLCKKSFKTHQQCTSHLLTKKHKMLFSKRDVDADGDDKAVELMTCISGNPLIEVRQVVIRKKRKKKLAQKADESKQHKKEQNEGQNEEEEEDDEQEQQEQDEPDLHPRNQRTAMTSTECLFCTESFDEQKLCVEHMTSKHGFFIPLPKRLIHEGLLLQEAGKVLGVCQQCPWCWKIFKSRRAVQSHCRNVGHCKLQLEYGSFITFSEKEEAHAQQTDDEELDDALEAVANEDECSVFAQYFDFDKEVHSDRDDDVAIGSGEEEDEAAAGSGQMMLHRHDRTVTEINDDDELVRSDGTLIGHRHHLAAYRQKAHQLSRNQERSTEEQLIAQINHPTRKLKFEQMAVEKNKIAFEESGIKNQQKHGKSVDDAYISLQSRQFKMNLNQWINLQKSKQLCGNQ